jgi:hypothetical protein
LGGSRRLERLTVRAEPYIYDPVAAHARIHATRDSLHLRQFWHRPILEGSANSRKLAGRSSSGQLIEYGRLENNFEKSIENQP